MINTVERDDLICVLQNHVESYMREKVSKKVRKLKISR